MIVVFDVFELSGSLGGGKRNRIGGEVEDMFQAG